MPLRLQTRQDDFQDRFTAFLADKREAAVDVDEQVADILDQVRRRGDAAVLEFTKKLELILELMI